MDSIIAKIKEYLLIINPEIDIASDLVNFVIGEVIDRVQLYLNSEKLPAHIERILANIVNTGLAKVQASISNNGEVEQAITSVSDNGQAISYANEVRKYFTTVSDEELFTGFASLLSRYRRIKVVHPKKNEE